MAAWTLPQRIAEWTSLLSTGLDRRSRNYLPLIVLRMVRSSERKTVSSWLVSHPLWGCIRLSLRALISARQKDLQVLQNVGRTP